MSGRIISTPVEAHRCTGLPSAAAHPEGAVWECDECGKQWVQVTGSQYNETFYTWRPVSTGSGYSNGSQN